MTGASTIPEYENVDAERGRIQNGNLTSAPTPPGYEPQSLPAIATSDPSELPPFVHMDCFSSANCHNSDMYTYTTDGYYATDGCYATDVSPFSDSVCPNGNHAQNV